MQTKKKGQALIELAVFGGIFMMIMAAMLSYGLRYNYIQSAQQLAYRRAMKIASDPDRGSSSYTLMMDKHIPDPADPFAIGTTMPIMASASVTRSYQLDAEPVPNDDKDNLPSTVVDIQTNQKNGKTDDLQRFVYTNAGYRHEKPSPSGLAYYNKNQVDKYRLIYGEVTLPFGTGFDEDSAGPPYEVRITDSCSGNVTDFNACYDQAVRLVDNDVCLNYCNDVNSDTTVSCAAICSDTVLLNPPNQKVKSYNNAMGGPWYAEGYYKQDGLWKFPVLEKLFNSLGSKSMGFQPDSNLVQVRDTSIHRTEDPASVVTQERVGWSDTNRRSFVYNNNLDAQGREKDHPIADEYADNIATDVYVSQVGGNYTEKWTTGK